MSKLIKAYAEELNKVQEEIEDLWSKYDAVVCDTIEEQKTPTEMEELYARYSITE